MPPLIHCQSYKPWRFPTVPSIFRETQRYFLCLYLEGSPYAHFARQFRARISPFPECLEIRTRLGKLSNAVSLQQPSIRGMTQAVAATSWKHLTRFADLAGKARRKAFRLAATLPKRLAHRHG
jgi:hypothetical protein